MAVPEPQLPPQDEDGGLSQARTTRWEESGPDRLMEPPCPPDPSLSTDSRHRTDTDFQPLFGDLSVTATSLSPHSGGWGRPIFYMWGWPPSQLRVLPQRSAQTGLLPRIPLDHFGNKRKNVHSEDTHRLWLPGDESHQEQKRPSHRPGGLPGQVPAL